VPTFQVAASAPSSRFHERLEIQLALGRQLFATGADVARLLVTVRDTYDVEQAQTLLASALVAGKATANFNTLPPGPVYVEVRAFDVLDRQLGTASRHLSLRPGVLNTVELTFYLEAAPPSAGPGQADVAVTIQDGATVVGPPPAAVPTFAPEQQNLRGPNLAGPFVLDRAGHIWVGESRIMQDGTVALYGGEPAKALAVNAQGQVWAHRGSKLQLLGGQFQVLQEVDAPWAIPRDGLAVDAADNLWVSCGDKLRKVTPAGVVAGAWDLPGNGASLAVDKVAGVVWVALAVQGMLARYSLAGALIGTTAVNQFGDQLTDLALDSLGNAWVPERLSFRVAKVRPNGTVAGHFQTVSQPLRVLVDAQDQVLVGATGMLGGFTYDAGVWRHANDGQLLAKYNVGPIWDWAFDAAGTLWTVRAEEWPESGGVITKVTL
jgi:hypothetical protein